MTTKAELEAEWAALQERIVSTFQTVGTISATARELKISRPTVAKWLKRAGVYDERPLFAGRISEREVRTLAAPEKGKIQRYILTCAQNNTLVADKVWENLVALRRHYERQGPASIMVSTFTYNKAAYGRKAVKRGTLKASDTEELWYDGRIEPHTVDYPVELAPGLVFCGEMNILPTAVKPLSGLEVYTGRKSMIVPHVKVQMQSIPSGKNEPTKFNYTTGTVTKRNYIQKKEGLKAEFHHIYGALVVEVNSDGDWWVRQLSADSRGRIYDLDLLADEGKVTSGHQVEAITWGDIHVAAPDVMVSKTAWGKGGMLDALHPRYQFMHDVLDFRARNGHTAKRNLIHDRFQAYIMGHDEVEKEIAEVGEFLLNSSRDWCKTVVVDSNHDHFMMEWLRIGDYRQDPVNAIFFLEAQLHVYKSIAQDPKSPINLLRWALQRQLGNPRNIKFLNEDESFVICPSYGGGIEGGWHGHLGPNGAKGGVTNHARMGRRINRGHDHSAGIFEGVFTAGLSGDNDQGYNKGPSSWSPSHILTYKNSKRAIVTMWQGRWRA